MLKYAKHLTRICSPTSSYQHYVCMYVHVVYVGHSVAYSVLGGGSSLANILLTERSRPKQGAVSRQQGSSYKLLNYFSCKHDVFLNAGSKLVLICFTVLCFSLLPWNLVAIFSLTHSRSRSSSLSTSLTLFLSPPPLSLLDPVSLSLSP